MKTGLSIVAAFAALGGAAYGAGQIAITELLYNSDNGGGEFFELTNIGDMAVDVTGWTMLDNDAAPDPTDYFDLSAFGSIAAGESVIVTELDAAAFRTQWSLAASVKVIGGLGDVTGKNLGRNDSVVIFDSMSAIIDRLDYGDQAFPGTPRPIDASIWAGVGAKGANDVYGWTQSTVGDFQNSYASTLGDIGNPGSHIPAPGAAAIFGLGALVAGRRRR